MINKKFSKLAAVLMVGAVLMTGCSNSAAERLSKEDKGDEKFVIGISQLAEHPALDDARRGFEDGIKELGIDAEMDVKNAQGDIPTTTMISEKFAKDKVDLIYAIATPAAQAAKQVTRDIPILFSAVTDPVKSGLTDSVDRPGGNLTGTSDEAPMERQLMLFKQLDPSIKTIGIIFDTSQSNSEIQIKMAQKLAPQLGLEIVAMGVSNINDIPQSMDSLIKKVDALYTIADNMVANAITIISEKALKSNMITVGAEEAHVKGGILITDGLSYYELGRQTAVMAKSILIDGKSPSDIAVEKAKNTSKVFNEKTRNKLGMDNNNEAFKDAAKFENQ